MNSTIHLTLGVNAETTKRLDELRRVFAQACNFIAPIAQKNHCWNRVALHHLSYHPLRRQFPSLGSQMACNAIYAVCRSYRLLLGHPASPFYEQKILEGKLPTLTFLERSPVFFDRHTLSLQNNQLSLFTLEGRLRFQVELSQADELRFRTEKLREVQLSAIREVYYLTMTFGSEETLKINGVVATDWPDYLVLSDQPTKLHEFPEISTSEPTLIERAS